MSEAEYIAEQIQIERLQITAMHKEYLQSLSDKALLEQYEKLADHAEGLNTTVPDNKFPAYTVAMRLKKSLFYRVTEQQRKSLINVLAYYAWKESIELEGENEDADIQ